MRLKSVSTHVYYLFCKIQFHSILHKTTKQLKIITFFNTETEIYVRGNQGFVFDTQRQYTLEIVCADQQRNDSSEFYIYILRNMPPYFTNIQGKYH